MSEDVLAYKLLKSANFLNQQKQLSKTMLPEQQYDLMKDQLNNTLSDSNRYVPIKGDDYIETEKGIISRNESIIDQARISF